jgi:Tfp pilus assembly protein PilX
VRRRQGVALVMTLLLLAMLMVLSLGMVLALSSDMLINGYYRNFRGAYYAADSGLNIARQALMNETLNQVPPSIPAGTTPLPSGVEATVRSALLAMYGSPQSINQGAASNAWQGSFRITNLTYQLLTNPPQPVVTATDGSGNPTAYQYTFMYTLTAVGRSQGSEESTVQEQGNLILNVALTPGGPTTQSFAAWGMFIDQYAVCSGSYLVPGTISGPVFTNGGWTFGTTGAYIFTDPVGQAAPKAGFQFSNKCVQSATTPVTQGTKTINPTFQSGFKVGQPNVPLPQNDFSQQRAVLDGMGTDTSPVTKNDLNNALRNINGTPYPVSGTTSGVWIPYTTDPITGVKTVTGGGIYVEGNATVTLSTSGTSAQVIQISQGGVITSITVDPAVNTTTITQGGTTQVLTGVFTDMSVTPARPATMVYVNGEITSLRGPAQGVPAIQDGSAMTITAASHITITGDLLYKTPPVTKTTDPVTGAPAGSLIPANHNGQVLGIFTAKGDVKLQNSQTNKNLEIDASIATISDGGTGGIINTGTAINTLTIIGGRIQNQIKNINSTTRNVWFDRRFSNGFAPPWFPATTISNPSVASTTSTASIQRTKWVNMSSL